MDYETIKTSDTGPFFKKKNLLRTINIVCGGNRKEITRFVSYK